MVCSEFSHLAISSSEHPPPYRVLGSFTVDVRTHKASWRLLSASPMICSVAPRRTTLHASPRGTPLNFRRVSSPIET